MEQIIYMNQNFNSLKDLEKFLIVNHSINTKDNFEWEAVEETALTFVEAPVSAILYFSLPEGAKMGSFSYRKVNQVICILFEENLKSKQEHYYYRVLRRLKSPSCRVKFLSATENEIKEALNAILMKPAGSFEPSEAVQFSFHLQQREEMDDFLNLCRENHVRNLEYANTFPVDLEETGGLGSFVNKEIFLFMGELDSKDLDIFILGLVESGFKLDKFTYQPIYKVKSHPGSV